VLSEAHLRAHLEPDEHVIAVGRCEDITLQGDIDSGGAGWTLVMVTDRHIRWVPHGLLRFATAVDLDDVDEAIERTSAHRYAITLRHTKVHALRLVPDPLRRLSGGEKEAVRELEATRLAFSRRDTEAARALRAQLADRRVIPTVIPSPPRKPTRGTGSLVELREDQ